MKTSSYLKSNSITKVALKPTKDCLLLVKKLMEITANRQREFYADAIINELCENFRLPPCEIYINNRNQWSSRKNGRLRSKTLGYYRQGKITIFNKTAVREKIVTPKTFFNTLLHEFMHHYDLHKLKIQSLHTAGFYTRINSLKEKLIAT